MKHNVTAEEVKQIKKIVEDSIGTLMLVQETNMNEAEKTRLFITACRTLGRVILWGTTLSHFHFQYFIWRCSFGYSFNVDEAIDYAILYGCAILEEVETYEKRLLDQGLVEEEDEDYEETDEEVIVEEDF
jgi:hypothetical protein